MIIFYANCSNKITRELHISHPDKIGQMMSPTSGFGVPKGIYAIDNGAFTKFNEQVFFQMLNKALKYHPPLFVCCPDVVGCRDRTIALWQYYKEEVKAFGFPVAFVAQDGCVPKDIPSDCDWIFVGGFDPWKMANAEKFVGLGKPVHVGRVNGMLRYRQCKIIGVDSVDGSGWFRAKDKKFYDFQEMVKGEKQCSMF